MLLLLPANIIVEYRHTDNKALRSSYTCTLGVVYIHPYIEASINLYSGISWLLYIPVPVRYGIHGYTNEKLLAHQELKAVPYVLLVFMLDQCYVSVRSVLDQCYVDVGIDIIPT